MPSAEAGPRIVEWQVPEVAAQARLDRALADHLEVPRNRVRRWLDRGLVQVDDDSSPKPSRVLRGGERILARLPEPASSSVIAQAGELSILYEHTDWVVLDKPAGLAVHPGAGRPDGTLANRLLARYPEMVEAGSPQRPGIVHRLDAGTTGVMVLARTERAYLALTKSFAERRVEKYYAAIVYGTASPHGRVDAAIGRDPRSRTRMAVRSDGRPAHTTWTLQSAAAGISWLAVQIHTGRTHQIRVHLRASNHPLVGDPVYGEARWRGLAPEARTHLRRFDRPALHARRLRFPDPSTGRILDFEAAVPDDMSSLWRNATATEAPDTSP